MRLAKNLGMILQAFQVQSKYERRAKSLRKMHVDFRRYKMRDLKNLCSICVLLLGTLAIATAQENGTITGQVTDPSGRQYRASRLAVTHTTSGEDSPHNQAHPASMRFPDWRSVPTISKLQKPDSRTTPKRISS